MKTGQVLIIGKQDGDPEQAIRLGFIASMLDGALPDAFQVFPYGEITLQGGEPFTVDEQAVRQVMETFNARGLDMVIDYEHQTEGGDFSSPDGKAPAAGWIRSLEDRGADGLWAKVEWTERARELLANREYRYYSPVFLVSKGDRRLVELLRVALTNAPRLNWIRPIVAKVAMVGRGALRQAQDERAQDERAEGEGQTMRRREVTWNC